jgi:hypothetical protein
MTNEAAERLRGHLRHAILDHAALSPEALDEVAWLADIDAALAAERKATVERIRTRLDKQFGVLAFVNPATGNNVGDMLDAEAERA